MSRKPNRYNILERGEEPIYSRKNGYDVPKDVYAWKLVVSANSIDELEERVYWLKIEDSLKSIKSMLSKRDDEWLK